MASIAVVGAGMAGLVAARELHKDHDVRVLEKSRGLGGRMATRYAEGYEFDHGAQFVTARSPRFAEFLGPLVAAGAVSIWSPRIVDWDGDEVAAPHRWGSNSPRYVGTPRMNAIGKYLGADMDVQLETTVARLERRQRRWRLFDAEERPIGEYDWIVLAAPAPQTKALIPEFVPLRQRLVSASMTGCFTLMLAFEQPLGLSWDAAYVNGTDIGWICVNSSKPARPKSCCLVAHSTNAWAEDHLSDDPESIKRHLLDEFRHVLGDATRDATYASLHRWRYANCEPQPGPGFDLDQQYRIAACGDWFRRGRVEDAFTSAVSLVEALGRVIR